MVRVSSFKLVAISFVLLHSLVLRLLNSPYLRMSVNVSLWLLVLGNEADHSSPSAKIKECSELYTHFPYAFMAWCIINVKVNFNLS
jgi:hypothetical protein